MCGEAQNAICDLCLDSLKNARGALENLLTECRNVQRLISRTKLNLGLKFAVAIRVAEHALRARTDD